MKKLQYIKPITEVLPIAAVPLMAGSPFEEGKTETGGGVYNEEVDDGWSRHDDHRNIWDEDDRDRRNPSGW